MAEGTQPKSAGLPRLPPWDLMATAAQLFEQQEHTHVMLKTYQTFLSDLISEFNEKNTNGVLSIHRDRLELPHKDKRHGAAQAGERCDDHGGGRACHVPEEGE